MKQNAFTLIEILAIIIVLAIIISIAVPLVSNSIDSTKEKIYIANEAMLVNAAKNYMSINTLSYPVNIGEVLTIDLDDLKENNILGDIKDPRDKNTSCEAYITIEKIDINQYDYKSYLKCGDNYVTDGYIGEDNIPTEGLVLHLDADSITGLNDGDKVSIWKDQSGVGNNATQATEANQPIYKIGILNSLPVVRFDGNDYLRESIGTYETPITIIAVGSNTTGAGNSGYSRLVDLHNTADVYGFFGSKDNNFATFFGNGSSWNDVSPNTPAESVLTPVLLAVVNDGTTATPYVDGVAQNTKGGIMATATGLQIGRGSTAGGTG